MSVFNIFSKRQAQLRGELPDVYQYENISEKLRVQVVHIWRDAFGSRGGRDNKIDETFEEIHDALCREYGFFKLQKSDDSYFDAVAKFMLESKETDKVLDVIELTFQAVDIKVRNNVSWYDYPLRKIKPDEAIDELNCRFRENGIGYQYESGEIIKVDSQILHAEVVRPVLAFLRDKTYKGANEEFLKAHEHYRKGNYKECLNECLKSFESTMKAICNKRRWAYNPNDNASKLIEICLSHNLVPNFSQAQLTSLRSTLESGIPTVRNKLSGHGQGVQHIAVSPSIASYMLHLTATTILFLVESDKQLS